MNVANRILNWAAEYLMKDKTSIMALSNEPLHEVLDSMAMVDLLSFLEREFDISIDDDEITPENFATLEVITKLVSDRLR